MQFLSILSFTLLAANTAVASSYNDYDSQLNDRDVYPEMLLEKYLL